MPEPTAPVAGTPALTDDQLLMSIALTGIFEQMLKKPPIDDDEQQASGITNEMNKMMASNMAQAVAAGFGT